MKHRLPQPKSSRIVRSPESPVDEIARQIDSSASLPKTRRATPPPLPVVKKSSSNSSFIEPPPSSVLSSDSKTAASDSPASPPIDTKIEKTPVKENNADSFEPFSFLSGVESPSVPEVKPKETPAPSVPEAKDADKINSPLQATQTTPTEQKIVDSPSTAKRKTRRVEPPTLPIETPVTAAAKNEPPVMKTPESDPNSYLIETRGLVKQYGGRRVVNGVDIHVGPGEVVGLLGKNGAGKTTTFYMIVGLVTPTIGHVYMGDEDVTRMPMYRRARRGIGYLPQEESIFRKLTVEENLLAILETLPLTEEERDARCDELLADFHLEHVRENVAITLSGGEKRRVTIARALVTSPTLLLLDEPFAGVDPMAVHDIQEIIQKLKNKGIGVLLTDHSVRETLSSVDRAYIIDDGRVVSEGTREFILNDPIAREIYLGHRFSM